MTAALRVSRRWPESQHRTRLAAVRMNASGDAGIYDTSARVRLAAVKLLTALAPALASRDRMQA